jgi:anaerobic magnesium-protoporphyrin IX monomethyl ester cyclase
MDLIKHKILLYNPIAVFYDMPLALLALGSCFDLTKYNIVIIDARIESNAHEKVLEEVKDAICFGTTVLTGKPIEDAIKITRKVKQQTPEIPTIWGEWHTSLFPTEPLLEELCIDITAQGEGEITFQELIKTFTTNSPLAEVKGICFSNPQGEIIKNPPRAMVNMEDLPPVDYELIDVEKYFEKKGRRQFDYITSVGCFYRFTFCADLFFLIENFLRSVQKVWEKNLESIIKNMLLQISIFRPKPFFPTETEW